MMLNRKRLLSVCFLFLLGTSTVRAELIDPEKYILKFGYHSKALGDDGKTPFYRLTERLAPEKISAIQREIERLQKHQEVFKVCDFLKGGVKAQLVEEQGLEYDVTLANYGHTGKIIACTLKYMHGDKVGTQLIFSKMTPTGMYSVFLTT